MFANNAGGNGSIGLRLRIDYAPDDAEVDVTVAGDLIKKGIWLDDLDDPAGIRPTPTVRCTFDDFVTVAAPRRRCQAAAESEGHLFTDDADASDVSLPW